VTVNTTNAVSTLEIGAAESDGTGSTNAVRIQSKTGASNQQLKIGINQTGTYSFLQSSQASVGYKSLALNPNGGNVLIGTTTFYNGLFSGSATGLNINGAVPISLLRESSSGNTFYMGLSSNAFIGTSAAIAIVFTTSDTERMRILSNGQIYTSNAPLDDWSMRVIGNSASGQSYGLKVLGGTNSADLAFSVTPQNGSVNYFKITGDGYASFSSLGTGTVTASGGTLSTISDMNLKIEDGFINNALDKVMNLKPRYYHWKKESGLPTDLRQLGFYAQEVNEALGEEAANTPKTENDKWGIYDRGMIAFLTAAIQEQQKQIEELKLKIK
jgi:hypothetical protein